MPVAQYEVRLGSAAILDHEVVDGSERTIPAGFLAITPLPAPEILSEIEIWNDEEGYTPYIGGGHDYSPTFLELVYPKMLDSELLDTAANIASLLRSYSDAGVDVDPNIVEVDVDNQNTLEAHGYVTQETDRRAGMLVGLFRRLRG